MQFQVPQFIEVEDKIFGPLTIKQFLYLAGGIGMGIIIWLYVPSKVIAVILILPIAAFALALAFYRMNGKPFIDVVESAFYYWIGDKLYIWKKADKQPEHTLSKDVAQAKAIVNVPKMSESKLKDLTWSLDIKESLNPVTHDET
ncbi:MAG: PrgI family protein [Patescibacteria group bacterium]|nr:PrgI family protein [Patescibacteria group bacterium]MDE1945743.1 PrgI family protein [Patescibacteria group bacterium]